MEWLFQSLPDILILLGIYIKIYYPKWKQLEHNAFLWHTAFYAYICIVGYISTTIDYNVLTGSMAMATIEEKHSIISYYLCLLDLFANAH